MKNILYIILASMLLVVGCDTTTTKQLLNGDFVPADTSVPTILSPEEGEVVINLTADLRWTSKEGAEYYTIEVATDEDFTQQITGSPFRVEAPNTFYKLTLPSAGTFFWRIRASVTAAGQYASTYFEAKEDCLYVYLPASQAKADDTNTNGNKNNPYQSINLAMAQAYQMGISKVRIASRGRITPTPPVDEPQFAAYEEYFSFKDGVSLEGGWNSDFTERHDFSTGFNNNEYETRLKGKYYQPMKIEGIYTSTLIEGFVLNPVLDGVAYSTGGFIIENCGRDLIIRNCKINSEGLGMSCAALLVKYSAAQIIYNTITSFESSSYNIYGVVNYYSDSEIIGNTITAPSVSVTSELSCISCGVKYSGDGLLINNLIIAGNTSGGIGSSIAESFGFYINSGNPLLINNTIVAGEATTVSANAHSYGLLNDSGCNPIIINNIIMTSDSAGDSYGVNGSGAGDVNYYYNCIYSNGGTDHNLTLDASNTTNVVGSNPLLDSDYKLTASSPPSVRTGGIIDPFTLAGITPLDEYLLDIEGVARTPDYVADSTATGWSIGAYEFTE